MKLKFITGSSGSGKTTYIANEIISKSIKNPEKNIICIVPEQFTLQAERNLIQISKSRSLFKIQVLSFKRLAYRVFSELGYSQKPLLNDISKAVLIRKILNDNYSNFNYFNYSICRRQGFIDKINKTISEFFQYCITKEKLDEIILKIEKNEENIDTALKLRDIRLIYSKYIDYIDKNYVCADETLDYLSKKLEESKLIKNADFYFDGFIGFTPQEFNVIECIFKSAENICMAISLDSPAAVFDFDIFDPYYDSKKTIKTLTETAKKNNVYLEKPIYLKENMRHKTNVELSFLEKNYFVYSCKKYTDEVSSISVYAALNKYTEMKNAAVYINSLVKKYNYRYSDIAVIIPGEQYLNYLADVFNKFNIPYFSDTKKSIKIHALTELIVSVFDIVSYNYSYESVFSYIKTGFLAECEKYDISKDELDILENYVLAYGIRGSGWKKDWIYGFGENSYFNYEILSKAKNIVLESLAPIKLENTKRYKVSEMAFCLMDFLMNIEAAKTLEKWNDQAEAEDRRAMLKKENIQVWKNVMQIIDDTVKILGESEMMPSEYADILNSAFESCQTSFVPSSQDQVLIGDFGRTRLPDIKALVILNANDGVLPASKEDSGFISDAEREYIRKNGMELAPDSKRLIAQDNFIAYNIMTKPCERLYLSYSISDINGQEMKQSLIIDKLKEIFPKLKIKLETSQKQVGIEDISAPEQVFEDLLKAIQGYKEVGELSDFYKDAYLFFSSEKSYDLKLKKLKLGLFKVNPSDRLSESSINKLYPKKIINSSVTRLEAFKKCPFSYFVRYGLMAEPRKSYEIGSIEIGNIYHSIMENFSKLLSENNIDWHKITQTEIDAYIDFAVNKSISAQNTDIFLSNAKYIHYIEKIRRTTKISAFALINSIKKGSFNPYGFEFSLRNPKTDENGNPIEEGSFFLKPIQIHLNNGYKILLDGKIDRIDIMDKDNRVYVNIIDYKSGSNALELQQIYAGVQLQLLLYLDAFIKLKSSDSEFKEKIIHPGGAFYFKISDPIFDGSINEEGENILTEKDFQKSFKHTGFVNNKKEVLKALNTTAGEKELEKIKASDFEYIKPSFFSEDELKYIMQYVSYAAAECASEMIDGNISIYPFVSDKINSCSYCKYDTICAIDIIDKKIYGENSKINRYKNISSADCFSEILKKLNIDINKTEDSREDNKKYE